MGFSTDNRIAKRYRLRTRVDLRTPGCSAAVGEVVNISMGGLFLMPGGLLPVGSRCELAIALPAGNGKGIVETEGTVVRNEECGTAVRFIRGLGEMTLDILAGSPDFKSGISFPDYIRAYFKVGQGMAEFECLRTFGISRRTFHRITMATFPLCLMCALLLAWLGRHWIADLHDWARVAGALTYGAIWLLVVHPAVDLVVIRLWRHGRRGRQ